MLPNLRRLALLTLILFSSSPITHAEWVDPSGRINCGAQFDQEVYSLKINLSFTTLPESGQWFNVFCEQQPFSWIFECQVDPSSNKIFSFSTNRLTTDSRDHWEKPSNHDMVCKEVMDLFNLSVPLPLPVGPKE